MKKFTLSIFLCILFSSFLSLNAQEKKKFTLEDFMLYGTFRSESLYGLRSLNSGVSYTTLEKGNSIVKYNYATGVQEGVVLNIGELEIENFSDYAFSADETKILLITDVESIFRHSYTATHYVYDLAAKKLTKLSENGRQELATFSPDGTKVAFVRNNNIYIKNLADNTETQITTDGKFNEIINGKPDWVYEEEFGYSQAFAWSPDGANIAYCKFNESAVKEFTMTMFAGMAPKLTDNVLYPETRTWKYPKAGDANSVLSVHCYNLASTKTNVFDIGSNTDIYIPRIKWNNTNELIIFRVNRLQNKLELLLAKPGIPETKAIYTDENKFFIDESIFDYTTFLPDNKNFIIASERNGYMQLYLCGLYDNTVKPITNGTYDITAYYGFEPKSSTIYYQSAESHATKRDVYAIKLDGKKKVKLSTLSGTNNAAFSTTFKYFINYYSSAKTPTVITMHDNTGKQLRELVNNDKLKQKLADYNFNYKELFSFKTSENVELNGWIIKPANFDATKQYPVWLTQYSGPNSQQVFDSWSFGWDYLLAQKDIIVVCVDGRGTGARGEEFRKVTYKELGKYEVADQIEVAKYLGAQTYVDKSRIGIWGWSYGGFMALNAITQGADYFKAAIAVAPVTNWRYYDNIYTERYMRTPQENASGYDNNSPINHAAKLKGKLLLVHGSADDNVHVQNSMEMSEALVQAGKQFDYFIYTNRNHGIYGGKTRMHLYTKMLDFIQTNL
ncbi:MAG TPA: S9 family peptidase [Bacteroidales bacterium]|nr:S9 family peptidase [Bacteroidales bacterium]